MTTPWQAFLGDRGARFEPQLVSFSTPREETKAAAASTVLVPLEHLGVIRLSGEEAAEFLHKLGSNDVTRQQPGQLRLNSLNSPKGRMLASFLVWRSGADYLLALSADLRTPIARKLSMYVLRAKVKVSEATERVLLGISGAAAAGLLAGAGLPTPAAAMEVAGDACRVMRLDDSRFIIDLAADQAPALWDALVAGGARPAGSAAWRWLDIQAGWPLVTAASQDEFVAQMLNFELLGGVNFQKGCYPGQEIVARTQYLGKLKKRMYRCHLAGDGSVLAGTDLYAPEFAAQSCGKVVSVEAAPEGGSDLLAVLQIAAFEAGEIHLGSPDGPRLEPAPLPYAID